MKEYEEPKNRAWDGDNFHYHIWYNAWSGKVVIGELWNSKIDDIYFESKEKARQAIDAVGNDRIKKYYLEVEE